jgi:hypothetical protein
MFDASTCQLVHAHCSILAQSPYCGVACCRVIPRRTSNHRANNGARVGGDRPRWQRPSPCPREPFLTLYTMSVDATPLGPGWRSDRQCAGFPGPGSRRPCTVPGLGWQVGSVIDPARSWGRSDVAAPGQHAKNDSIPPGPGERAESDCCAWEGGGVSTGGGGQRQAIAAIAGVVVGAVVNVSTGMLTQQWSLGWLAATFAFVAVGGGLLAWLTYRAEAVPDSVVPVRVSATADGAIGAGGSVSGASTKVSRPLEALQTRTPSRAKTSGGVSASGLGAIAAGGDVRNCQTEVCLDEPASS